MQDRPIDLTQPSIAGRITWLARLPLGYGNLDMDYSEWPSLNNDELAGWDVAEINLKCATGLPNTPDIEPDSCLRVLEQWTNLVREGTGRALSNRHSFPEYDELSEAEYRILTMYAVLYRHAGLTVNTDFLASSTAYDGSDSRFTLFTLCWQTRSRRLAVQHR
jgi:hypothetical protein